MARTSYKRSLRLTGRKEPNAVGNLPPDISLMDPRNALRLPEDDRRKNTVVPVPSISFVIPRLDRGICKGDPWVKPEDDKEKKSLFRGA